MAYTNKTYVCFDADSDILYYNLMKAWKENDKIEFNFHNAHEINNLRDGSSEATIKTKLRERLQNTKVLIVLIGDKTANLFKYVRWEIEWAIENNIPIVVANLNKKKAIDYNLCPAILKDKLAIHIPFGQKIIDYALNSWTTWHYTHKKDGKSGPFHFEDSVYKNLGI